MNDVVLDNIILENPTENSVPNSKLTYNRLAIRYNNGANGIGRFLIKTPWLRTYGITEANNLDSVSYSLVLPLSTQGASTEQLEWVEKFEAIIEHLKELTRKKRDEVPNFDFKTKFLDNFANALKWRELKDANGRDIEDEDGNVIYDRERGPTLFLKCIVPDANRTDSANSNNDYGTTFYGPRETVFKMEEMIQRRGRARCVISIESVFSNSQRTCLQLKLKEAKFIPDPPRSKRLSSPFPEDTSQAPVKQARVFDDDDDTGSIDNGV